MRRVATGAGVVLLGGAGGRGVRAEGPGEGLAGEAFGFIARCAREDGGYAPSPDPDYGGTSDTSLSDLAAVAYAAVLARTMGRDLTDPGRSIAYIKERQRPDGRFVHREGGLDRESDHAVLYNTTQGVVALRALGERPAVDPTPVVAEILEGGRYRDLPWFTTSFFPLFYAAMGRPFPDRYADELAAHMEANQAEDGYLGDHVASTFHMAHFFRLLGRPTPRADRMVDRTLRDQKADGSWTIKDPDWDVHAGFDAAFILRQLGAPDLVGPALDRAARWAETCRNPDGGFGHYPGRPSDMDAVYFQLGTLIQAGRLPGARRDLSDAHTLGWGHAMEPGRVYENKPIEES